MRSARPVIALSTPSDRIHVAIAERIRQMAATLVTYQATASESDAVRCLFGRGFSTDEIALHAGRALVEAQRIVVAHEMRN